MQTDNNFDPTFEVMINSDRTEDDIFNLLLLNLESASKEGGYILSSGNVLKLDSNSLYSEDTNVDDEEAWMYYKLNLCVFPDSTNSKIANLNNQISLAKKIIHILRNSDCLVELVAEFEI